MKNFSTWNDEQISRLITHKDFASSLDVDFIFTFLLSNKANVQRLIEYCSNPNNEKDIDKFGSYLEGNKELTEFFTPDLIIKLKYGVDLKSLGSQLKGTFTLSGINGLNKMWQYISNLSDDDSEPNIKLEGSCVEEVFISDNPPSYLVKGKLNLLMEEDLPPVEVMGIIQCHFSDDHKISKVSLMCYSEAH